MQNSGLGLSKNKVTNLRKWRQRKTTSVTRTGKNPVSVGQKSLVYAEFNAKKVL